ncbi:MAG: fibronectin type III domain-containing protein, partial [Schleiferiaceae bacterium]
DQSFLDGANPTATAGPGIDIGFDFVFNGQIMNKLGVNANGFIALGYNGVTISSSYGGFTTTQNLVKGFNHDLQSHPTGDLRVATVGTAPNRECVIQWTNYKKYGASYNTDTINFQIRLAEGSNNIKFVYGKVKTAYVGTSFKPTLGISGNGAMLALGGTSWTTTPTTYATYSSTNNLPYTATVAPDNGRTIQLTAPAMCVAPAITATTTTTSATLTFANGSTGTTYSIEYGPAPLTAGTGTVVSSATSPYTITGLTAATNYSFIVTANCGGSLTNAATVSAATQCVVISTFPYTESFEAAGWVLGNRAVPTCFTNTTNATTTSYAWLPEDLTTPSSGTGPTGPQDGLKYMFLETSFGSTGNSAYLEFPEFNTTSLGTPQLKYYYHMFGPTTGKLIVERFDGTNWVGIDSLIGQQQAATGDAWLDRAVNLPSAASVKIRFRGVRGTSFTG